MIAISKLLSKKKSLKQFPLNYLTNNANFMRLPTKEFTPQQKFIRLFSSSSKNKIVSSSPSSSENKKEEIVTLKRKITQAEVDKFTELTGDLNPIHSSKTSIESRFVPGALLNGIVSGIIGTKLPGPGSIVISQKLQFTKKCLVEKDVRFSVRIVEKRKIIKVIYDCEQDGEIVFKGDAKLVLSTHSTPKKDEIPEF